MLTVFRPGTRVTLSGNLRGVVVQTCIQAGNHIQYQVAWWDGNSRNLQWLEEGEVAAPDDVQTLRIGFADGGA